MKYKRTAYWTGWFFISMSLIYTVFDLSEQVPMGIRTHPLEPMMIYDILFFFLMGTILLIRVWTDRSEDV